MFDIGFWEIMIITLVALLVVGPARLPGLAREIGRFVGKTKRFVNSVRSDIEQEFQTEELRKMLKDQESEIQGLKSMMHETEETLRDDLKDTAKALREDLDDTEDSQRRRELEGRSQPVGPAGASATRKPAQPKPTPIPAEPAAAGTDPAETAATKAAEADSQPAESARPKSAQHFRSKLKPTAPEPEPEPTPARAGTPDGGTSDPEPEPGARTASTAKTGTAKSGKKTKAKRPSEPGDPTGAA